MKSEAGRSDRGFRLRDMASYALIVGGVWLGWEVVKGAVVDRAPPAMAVRLAPGSPEVLRRAAEVELAAGRTENARVLSDESLSRAPFNARALRVRGLAEARLAKPGRADDMLTLAGNWSLRDDPAHGWLTEHRLRRGDYASAFAHADTLARRRTELYPNLFRLFTTAATEDPRSIPVLARILAPRPPWRQDYFWSLMGSDRGAATIGALAISLEPTEGRLSDDELRQLYADWTAKGRFAGIVELRRYIRRPGPADELQNTGFSVEPDDQLIPFGWRLGTGSGISTGVVEDDLRPGNQALRLQYDGFGSGVFTEQLVLLKPGDYVLLGEQRVETPQTQIYLDWEVACAETGAVAALQPAPLVGAGWKRFEVRFRIPANNCRAQWVRLKARPGDRRTTIAAWVDNLRIAKAARAGASGPQPATEPSV